jgi:hypothetical protein
MTLRERRAARRRLDAPPLRWRLKAHLEVARTPQRGKISKQSVTVDGVTATRVTFAPGEERTRGVARWYVR